MVQAFTNYLNTLILPRRLSVLVLVMQQSSASGVSKALSEGVDKVKQDMDRDYFMTSEEAVEYGLIDRVIAHR